MIRALNGDHVLIVADEDSVTIRAGGQVMRLEDAQWRELVYLLEIVGKANSDRPA